jgi:hypothetical protein
LSIKTKKNIYLLIGILVFGLCIFVGCYRDEYQVDRQPSGNPIVAALNWASENPNRYHLFVVGTSMTPQIKEGEIACMEKYDGVSALRVGMIVQVYYSEKLPSVLHRIVAIDRNRILTAGDNNHYYDYSAHTWLPAKDAKWLDRKHVNGILVKVLTKNP